MNPYEAIAEKIVNDGVPMLLKGGGKATELKLRYCPACGSTVSLYCGAYLSYWAVKWRCKRRGCDLFGQWQPLHGWNEYYQPNPHTLLIETLKEIGFKKELAQSERIARTEVIRSAPVITKPATNKTWE